MQYLNNTVMDYSLIKLHSDISKEILSYGKARGPGVARQNEHARSTLIIEQFSKILSD